MFISLILISTIAASARAQRQMENLGRGLIAVVRPDRKVYLSWRLLGTDADNIAFNVYRTTTGGNPIKLNDNPILTSTNFIDDDPPLAKGATHCVRPILSGHKADPSAPFALPPNAPERQYLEIPLTTPRP